MLKMIYKGDPAVWEMLGKQKLPAEAVNEEETGPSFAPFIVKPTIYLVRKYVDGFYLIFHVLTRAMYLAPASWVHYLVDEYRGKLELDNEIQKELFQNWFLVDESLDETQLYLDTRERMLENDKCPGGLRHFTILPTSACNARCTYCFEEGMRYQKMSPETVVAVVQFIISQAPKRNDTFAGDQPVNKESILYLPEENNKPLTREELDFEAAKTAGNDRILLSWFGGEPLCAPDNIDRICSALIEAGIAFDSDMISNGSLFTEEMVRRAIDVWHLREVQITLDGLEEEYLRRKRYSSSVEDPFGTVIHNIHILLQHEIRVIIRLNLDYQNAGQLFLLVDYLASEFPASSEERKFLHVYSEPIKYDTIDGNDEVQAISRDLHYHIEQKGLATSYGVNLQKLKLDFCMADAPQGNVVICADGSLNLCDQLCESMTYGDVYSGITKPDVWAELNSPAVLAEECDNCKWLPECTPFMKAKCPNQIIECKPRMRRFFEEGINRAYFNYCANENLHENGSTIFVKMADLVIEIKHHYRYVAELCHDYIIWDESRKDEFDENILNDLNADIFIEISDEEIDMEIDREKIYLAGVERGYVEAVCIYEKLSLELFRFDAFILHSSVIELDGKAYCFAANSGVGKSTHTRYWRLKYPQVRVINGDKPIYRVRDGVVMAYGTPWCGKEGWNENISAPLRGLCFLEQGEVNHIERVNGFEHMNKMMRQIYLPAGKGDRVKLMEMLDVLLEQVPIYRLIVRQEIQAAEIAHDGMINS